MNGKELLQRLKKLSEIKSGKDIPQLTHALFPGTHCPLMGAALAVRGIADSLIVVVGTDECVYYTKTLTLHSEAFGGIGGRCVSVVLDGHDVTFGSLEKVEAAFEEIMDEYRPACVFLVTTCVIEIIGDDFDALAATLTGKYSVPIMAVHTEHFKCEDHLPGLERTLTACFGLMGKMPPDGRVNVLGQRLGEFEKTELAEILREAGVTVGLRLPSGCVPEEIRVAAGAALNIVIDDIALPLAQKMQEKFGIPYVYFSRFISPDNTLRAYQKLFAELKKPLPEKITVLHKKAEAIVRQKAVKLQAATYIYGNTPFASLEFNLFLTSIGLIPELIQLSRFSEQDRIDAESMVKLYDPYVCKAANIAPLQYIYDELRPYLYFGHEFADRLRKKGIAVVPLERAYNMLGFETTSYLLAQIEQAYSTAQEYRAETEGEYEFM